MQFMFFHLMPYPYLPADLKERHESTWVTLPNALFDPHKGAELYHRYLDEMELAEQLGFDGVCVNEHHQNAYGTMPSPNVMAATLARRTSRVKIALMGNGIPLRDHPLRVAEEVAMLDCISRGRIISGFVRGIGPEYHTFSMSPADSRERFLEAHDLLVRAWTEPGPFQFEGKHYRFRYVNPWPRPYQQPHPPIWIPSQGSGETIVWAAKRRYPFLMVYSPLKTIQRLFNEYREQARTNGYEASPSQFGMMAPTYIADTDEQAHAEARPHIEWLFNKGLNMPLQFLFPPGYVTEQSYERMLTVSGKATTSGNAFASLTYEQVVDRQYAVIGSAKTVTETLRQYEEEVGIGIYCALLQIGDMPHERTVRNMERFATEVMPKLRSAAPVAAVGR